MNTMKIKTISILGMILLLSAAIPTVYAKGPSGRAGKSKIQRLYLFEKDDNWDVVEDGAWGKMKYNMKSGKFVFNGHGLDAGIDYTLINFARNGDEWPATILALGEGTVNLDGNIHIKGKIPYTELLDDTTPEEDEVGAKIWLVLSADITLDPDQIVGWNPAEYLFEAALIPLLSP